MSAHTLGWLLTSASSVGAVILAAIVFVPRELWKRWRGRLVDRLDLALRRKVSRFDRRYREFMLSSLRFIDIKGLATVGYFTPELDAVFVDVSLAYRAPHQIQEGLLAKLSADVTDRHSIGDFLDLPEPMVLAVIGVPGSGKTTLLRHTARALCQARQRVPILLYLRDHIEPIVSTPDISLPALVNRTLGRHGPVEPPGWFDQRLRDGACVVLLDGLDEVARPDDRKRVAAWVERQTTLYPRNRFVITSRPQGYRTAGIEGAVVLQVRGFTDEQVARFVRGWYLAAEKHSTGTSGDDVRLRAEQAADELLDRLNAAPNLYDLTINPLLLTMIANVHRYRSALPGSRADLYGEICQVMLWRRQEAKNLPVELSGDKKETLLRGLAYTMMQRQVRDLPRSHVLAELKPGLRRMSTRLSEVDFLADVSSNGLLIERESGQFSFAHLTFQEYLAAAHIRDRNLVQTLADSVDDVWWHETTLLYCARSDADPIIKACLDSGTVPALSLAFDCVAQGSEHAPELGNRLAGLLDAASNDPARRQLRAGVLVARNLRDVVRTTAGGRVCAQPISWEVYQCYLSDTGAPAPDGRWTGPHQPVAGVRQADAVDFLDWVNEISAFQPVYRLPTRADIEDPAVQRILARAPHLRVWLDPTSEYGLLAAWIPIPPTSQYTVNSMTLAGHLTADFERSIPTFSRLFLLHTFVAANALALTNDPGGELGLDQIIDYARSVKIPMITLGPGACADDYELPTDALFDWILAFDHALDLARALERTRDMFLNASGKTAHQGRRLYNMTDALRRAIVGGLGSAIDFARTIAPDFGPGTFLAPAQIAANLRDATITGRGLRSVVRFSINRARELNKAWAARCAQTLLDEAEFPAAIQVSLSALADYTREAPDWVRTWLEAPPGGWIYKVAVRLDEIAQPILTRQQPLTAETATAIRLAAMCLAAEAAAVDPVVGGDGNFREIAAGITLLERRQSGDAPATETIMLATA